MTQPVAPPQLSPDGHWWWNGTEWVPADQRPMPEPVVETAAPAGFLPPVTVLPYAAAPQPTAYVPPGYGNPGYGPAPSSGNDGLAITSLVLGVLWLGGLGSVGAIVTGHMSRSKAKQEGRQPSGLALAGLIIGYIGASFMAIMVLTAIAIPVFLNQRNVDTAAQAKANLRNLAVAEETFMTDNGTYTGDLNALRASGFAESDGVQVAVLAVDARQYCLGAHKLTRTYYYDSVTGQVSTTSCA